jgi:predicted enzyme related to lactoylglutathione lyase
MKKSPVVHFEMPAKDNTRAAKFYKNAFGWDMHELGSEMGNYLLAGTTDTDEKRMVKTPGTINGGFFKYDDKPGMNIPHVVIQVQDLKESMEQVLKNGGKIEGDPMDIAGIGTYVSFIDSEDNRVGMLQPGQS